MRRVSVLVAAGALILAACGGGDGGAKDPASIENCDELAEARFDLLQESIDAIDDLSPEQLASLGLEEEVPQVFANIEVRGEELEARAETLGCSEEQLTQYIVDNADRLEAKSDFGKLFVESIRGGQVEVFEE
ncbi:MAG: hypothetical protein ACE5KX_07380 [Acidimicrobiia bacterium]